MDQLISEISTDEFDTIIDQYIERESQDMDEIEAPIFYQALRDIFTVSEVEETVELQGNVVDSQLELLPKESIWLNITRRGDKRERNYCQSSSYCYSSQSADSCDGLNPIRLSRR